MYLEKITILVSAVACLTSIAECAQGMSIEDLPGTVWTMSYLESQEDDQESWLGFSSSGLAGLAAWGEFQWIAGNHDEEIVLRIRVPERFCADKISQSATPFDIELFRDLVTLEHRMLVEKGSGNLAASIAFHNYLHQVAFVLICKDLTSSTERSEIVSGLDGLFCRHVEIYADMLLAEGLIDLSRANDVKSCTPSQVWDELSSIRVNVDIPLGETTQVPILSLASLVPRLGPWESEDFNEFSSCFFRVALTHDVLRCASLLMNASGGIPESSQAIDSALAGQGIDESAFAAFHSFVNAMESITQKRISMGVFADQELRMQFEMTNCIQRWRCESEPTYSGF